MVKKMFKEKSLLIQVVEGAANLVVSGFAIALILGGFILGAAVPIAAIKYIFGG